MDDAYAIVYRLLCDGLFLFFGLWLLFSFGLGSQVRWIDKLFK